VSRSSIDSCQDMIDRNTKYAKNTIKNELSEAKKYLDKL